MSIDLHFWFISTSKTFISLAFFQIAIKNPSASVIWNSHNSWSIFSWWSIVNGFTESLSDIIWSCLVSFKCENSDKLIICSAHAFDISIFRYAGSIATRRKWKLIDSRYYMQLFQALWTLSGQEYDFNGVYYYLLGRLYNWYQFSVQQKRSRPTVDLSLRPRWQPILLHDSVFNIWSHYPQANGIFERRIK